MIPPHPFAHPAVPYYYFYPLPHPRSSQALVGLEPEAPEREPNRTEEGIVDAFKRITPGVILVAIATGASFAVGNWIAQSYILPKK